MVRIMIFCTFFLVPFCNATAESIGQFEGQTDVGDIKVPGDAAFDTEKNQYKITASGENMWFDKDAFHFVWKKLSGDLTLSTDIAWIGEGKNPHRKAGWVIRQTLDANSPYIDAVIHGDGLISMQYREVAGSMTLEVPRSVKQIVPIKLQRNGDLFTLSVAPDGKTFQSVGSKSLKLKDPVYVGLAVCSHEVDTTETAVFSNVKLENHGVVSMKERILESTLETIELDTGERKTIYRALEHFEAPNWSRDGKTLFYNSSGLIYTIPVDGGKPTLLDTGEAIKCNNDHGLSPDGKYLVVSSQHTPDNKSLIYILPSTGGAARLVTKQAPSYWHGWSPDGNTLAYCAERNGEYDIYTIPAEGGEETQLTTARGLDDGPDYSPDGKYIFFNSERTGLMKIWRMNADGTDQQQVTLDDEYADWFPHPSPDGKWIVFVSYDKTVKGHPANKDVALRIKPLGPGESKVLTNLFGGQGTINVPSWSPDSKRIAFVSYRLVPPK